MLDKNNKLALVLGGGGLVESLLIELSKRKISYIIIAINKFYELNERYPPDYNLSYNNLGKVFSILRQNNIGKIVFLGKIKKLKLINLRPDLITFYYVMKVIFYYNKGDGQLLNKILNIFIKKNIEILDSRNFLVNNVAKSKIINKKYYYNFLKKKKALKYFYLAKKFGIKDKGQCVIIHKDKVVLSEDENGTDFLIKKFQNFTCEGKSFLVKTSKPNQSLNIDLPTVGPDTISNMRSVGICGLIVESNKTFIVQPKKTYYLIKKYKIFYYAI